MINYEQQHNTFIQLLTGSLTKHSTKLTFTQKRFLTSHLFMAVKLTR